MSKVIIAIGLGEIGHTYAGPFNNQKDAEDWIMQDTTFHRENCRILPLMTPKQVIKNLKRHTTEK